MIEKLNWDVYNGVKDDDYQKDKAKFIAEWEEYIDGKYTGVFGLHYEAGYYKKDAVRGLIEWNKLYPNGYEEWVKYKKVLTTGGIQSLSDKIDELVEQMNKFMEVGGDKNN